jgi:hypothetical protein
VQCTVHMMMISAQQNILILQICNVFPGERGGGVWSQFNAKYMQSTFFSQVHTVQNACAAQSGQLVLPEFNFDRQYYYQRVLNDL